MLSGRREKQKKFVEHMENFKMRMAVIKLVWLALILIS